MASRLDSKQLLVRSIRLITVIWLAIGMRGLVSGQEKNQSLDSAQRFQELRRSHWAFQPIDHSNPPQVRDSTWPLNALDHFILNRLEQAKLTPSPRADRRTLIRRAFINLLGLPARFEDVEEFIHDKSPGAFVNSQHKEVHKLVENIRNPHLNLREQRHQVDLLQAFNRRHLKKRGYDPQLEARIQSYEQDYRMQTAATDAFDIDREPQKVRDLYGDSVQGRQLLMARRLVERGVRFVQLWHGAGQPWDNHDEIENNHRKLAGQCSPGIGALLADLKERGLFENTLVILGGEFGRTPTVEHNDSGGKKQGRDHNPYGFSICLAGGGVKGGMVYGATDEFGFQAVEKPVHVHDLHATILHLMGFDHERLTYRYASRDFRLTDVHGHVVREILA